RPRFKSFSPRFMTLMMGEHGQCCGNPACCPSILLRLGIEIRTVAGLLLAPTVRIINQYISHERLSFFIQVVPEQPSRESESSYSYPSLARREEALAFPTPFR